MRRHATILLLLGLLAGGCGLFDDPWPSTRRISERIPAGESEKDAKVIGSISGDEWWLEYDVDVDDLPPGIHYETLGLSREPVYEDLVLEYRIRVDEWVEPGLYRFHVHYDYLEDEDDWFRTEVIVRFSVRVLEPEEEAGPLELRLVQTVPAGRTEAAVAITSTR